MIIGPVDLKSDILVIAEIGNNHEGDFGRAREMIHAAAMTGVQAVKFQTIVPERLVNVSQTSRLQQLARFVFSRDQFEELAAEARRAGVLFLSTPFDPAVVDWLDALVPAFKIASGDNNYTSLLEKVSNTGKPILLSTGMSSGEDITRTCAMIESCWDMVGNRSEIVLLHCVSAYPTLPEHANLRAIVTLARETKRMVGYSDHTLGIDAALLSVALGSRVIEKHFTLSKTQSEFRDHAISADPEEMADLVRRVNLAQRMLGDGVKQPQESEQPSLIAARRSIVARKALPIGHVIAIQDLDWLRPGEGLSPGQENLLIGRKLLRIVAKGEMLKLEMVV